MGRSSKWCRYCQEHVLTVREFQYGAGPGIALLLTLATCGLMLPLLLWTTRPVYRCSRCGR